MTTHRYLIVAIVEANRKIIGSDQIMLCTTKPMNRKRPIARIDVVEQVVTELPPKKPTKSTKRRT